MRRIECGAEKADLVEQAGAPGVIAIGNGRNDVAMLERAGLAIAVIGPEGAAGELLRAADVVVRDIHDALDLILYPLRLKATLRD
jgi:soluble P-type ATPase